MRSSPPVSAPSTPPVRETLSEPSPMAVVYLARHGMHDWLKPGQNRLAGRLPGIGLNAEGREEVQRMAALLAAEELSWIAASPLQRTVETAEIVARERGLDVVTDDRLLEWNCRVWEGKEIAEIQRRYPVEWEIWRERPDLLRLSGAETVAEVASRMTAAYRDWAPRGGTGMLVSHQDPLAALLCTLVRAPLRGMRAMEIQTGSLAQTREMPYGTVVSSINLGVLQR